MVSWTQGCTVLATGNLDEVVMVFIRKPNCQAVSELMFSAVQHSPNSGPDHSPVQFSSLSKWQVGMFLSMSPRQYGGI